MGSRKYCRSHLKGRDVATSQEKCTVYLFHHFYATLLKSETTRLDATLIRSLALLSISEAEAVRAMLKKELQYGIFLRRKSAHLRSSDGLRASRMYNKNKFRRVPSSWRIMRWYCFRRCQGITCLSGLAESSRLLNPSGNSTHLRSPSECIERTINIDIKRTNTRITPSMPNTPIQKCSRRSGLETPSICGIKAVNRKTGEGLADHSLAEKCLILSAEA